MPTTQAHADFEEKTSSRPRELELCVPSLAPLSPDMADRLRLEASRWLTQAQREFHDALFAKDGSDESLDRYANARAELDSAEAWACHVVRSLRSS
jgi:hypothetical protein